MSAMTATHGTPAAERKFPPIAEICVATLISMVIGGVFVAGHLPNHVSIALPTALIAIAGALVVVNMVLLTRIANFAWARFMQVAKWTLLAEGIIAGILEYVFIFDGTRGSVLALMTSALVIFVLDLCILFGFTVARFEE